eukprot:1507239-Prymnesium_polylepis.2
MGALGGWRSCAESWGVAPLSQGPGRESAAAGVAVVLLWCCAPAGFEAATRGCGCRRSGPTAFLDEEVGYPLQYTVVPVPDEMQLPGHSWADPSVVHLRALMRRVVAAPDDARARGRAARERMVRDFGPEALARRVEGELRRIRDGIHATRRSRDEL